MKNVKAIGRWKTSGGVVRVLLGTYKGQIRLDIRKWYKKDGTLEPTKKGINLNPADIGNLHKALMRADKWIKMGKG